MESESELESIQIRRFRTRIGSYNRLLNLGIIIKLLGTISINYQTSITPFGATNGASEIVGLAHAKLRRGSPTNCSRHPANRSLTVYQI